MSKLVLNKRGIIQGDYGRQYKMSYEEDTAQVEPAKWKSLELFRTVYHDDDDFDKLDVLYPGRIGYVYKNDDGTVDRIVIAKVWPHKFGDGDADETALFGPGDQ